ncbi:dethiobiotin synthase [Buchnera aphidicola (Muscaphis stroyani)]|uniref:ATP-dependent dethiobiotin synthetase BioD n=1 Tax=Buchnera aphidicola (Muscaphis stroyani) TaxID=1241869 RepID=A0A4D6YCU1_9GAMM|nr:dethiobiotin synthase [Buchnera aphidicola]QCI24361.1 dethiobiotin synthase [Buchnera aphidicola (Muscaphis stroyani)]
MKNNTIVPKKFFITGTDTNVGKTIVSGILLKKANEAGYQTVGYKPVASSSINKKSKFLNNDAIILKNNSSISLEYESVNPILFSENAPPHILSQLKGKKITKKHLSLGLKKISHKANWILVEGAGGWYTPLSYKDTFADWVKEEKLIVILIVGIKLGCINHAILTERAILSNKLICGGWIANNLFFQYKYTSYYIHTLLSYIKSPLLGIIPYFKYTHNINIKKIKIKLPE